MKLYYQAEGSVRGNCGHHHRTVVAAQRCVSRDQDGCASQGGYSDRRVIRSDGEPLTDAELDEVYSVECY